MYSAPENDDKFIQIIKIIKLGKNLGRNEKTYVGIPTLDIGIPTLEFQCPTLEYLCWTLEFQRRNSNVQRRNSNVGIPT